MVKLKDKFFKVLKREYLMINLQHSSQINSGKFYDKKLTKLGYIPVKLLESKV